MASSARGARGRTWPVLALALAGGSCGDPSPLAPEAGQPLRGTYTFTVSMSSACPRPGSWTFRADIEQNGASLAVTLFEGDFDMFLGERFNVFAGQTDGQSVVFGPVSSGGVVFSEENAGLWQGQARGELRNGRIEATFEGRVFFSGSAQPGGDECVRPDHTWTFVRR